MTGHTPGPWRVVPVHGDLCVWDVESKEGLIACDIGLAENATLLAAAPVMLVALMAAEIALDMNLRSGDPATLASVRTAIARAEGREP